MRIAVSGGGPAGLYFALLARRRLGAEVTVYEQNPEGATYGFGIVLAERGLDRLRGADRPSHDAIMAASFVTRHREISLRGERLFIEGGGYGGAIARLRLLDILRCHAERAGVVLAFESRLDDPGQLDVDLVVGADGVNSVVRGRHAETLGATSHVLGNKLAWYGTRRHFAYPILSFKTVGGGRYWCAAYPYSETMGTFVAECDAASWQASGLEAMDDDARRLFTERIFADELQGQPLVSNKSNWHSLAVTRVARWHTDRTVLIGDALQSAHPTIGSGTRMAMEDAIALVDALAGSRHDLPAALAGFQAVRGPEKAKLVRAADRSIAWYEDVGDKIETLDPATFVFDFMTRTGRIDARRLRAEYPRFMAQYADEWARFANPRAAA